MRCFGMMCEFWFQHVEIYSFSVYWVLAKIISFPYREGDIGLIPTEQLKYSPVGKLYFLLNNQ
jgi:hypothetical protein